MRLAVPKWTRRQGEETPLGPSSGEEDSHIPRRDELQGEEPPLLSGFTLQTGLCPATASLEWKMGSGSSFGSSQLSAAVACEVVLSHSALLPGVDVEG